MAEQFLATRYGNRDFITVEGLQIRVAVDIDFSNLEVRRRNL
jgi:hypothetical protein